MKLNIWICVIIFSFTHTNELNKSSSSSSLISFDDSDDFSVVTTKKDKEKNYKPQLTPVYKAELREKWSKAIHQIILRNREQKRTLQESEDKKLRQIQEQEMLMKQLFPEINTLSITSSHDLQHRYSDEFIPEITILNPFDILRKKITQVSTFIDTGLTNLAAYLAYGDQRRDLPYSYTNAYDTYNSENTDTCFLEETNLHLKLD